MMTNGELYQALDPYNYYKVNCIYDSFKWPHCAQEGYYFVSVAVGE